MRIGLAVLFISHVAAGCAPRAAFDVTVVNHTNSPLTIGLVKDGPPFEDQWATPDEVALHTGGLDAMPPWGHVVPPGRTLDSPAVTGAFPEGTTANLRVYRGERRNAELLAISDPSPDRAQVLLFPGHNEIVVTEGPKGLRAERTRRAAPSPSTGR